MAEIPGDIANAASSGRVPKGIDLSYLAQERNEPTIIATLFVFSLTTFVIILRCSTVNEKLDRRMTSHESQIECQT